MALLHSMYRTSSSSTTSQQNRNHSIHSAETAEVTLKKFCYNIAREFLGPCSLLVAALHSAAGSSLNNEAAET